LFSNLGSYDCDTIQLLKKDNPKRDPKRGGAWFLAQCGYGSQGIGSTTKNQISMSINFFTPVTGLIGGSLIGLSAATLLLFNGDILGASGLMSSFVVAPKKTLTDPSQHWKLAFLAAFCLTTRVLIDPDALKDEKMQGYSSGVPLVSP